MAMRNSRIVVFSAAFSSLVVMTVLSGIVGHALLHNFTKINTILASALFIIFGVKLLREGLAMSKDVGVDEEMAEVEEEIAMSKLNTQMNDIEGGGVSNTEGVTNFLLQIIILQFMLKLAIRFKIWQHLYLHQFGFKYLS